jgi:hypothetical protein
MKKSITGSSTSTTERGSTLFIVASSMLVILGLSGLAIDLVALYSGKSEAQRSADAAALAGATTFVTSGFSSGVITQAAVQPLATNQAIAVGQQNKIAGITPGIPTSNVTFDFSHAGNPLITAAVNASLPTFFMKVFGINSVNISATATAEAYNPSGTTSGPIVCATCLKPFLIPNCDPNHTAPASPVCTGQAVFVNPDGSIANTGKSPTGVVGQTWLLHSNGSAPSHWYEVALDGQSGSNFKNDLSTCSDNKLTCGSFLTVLDGKKVGPTDQGVNDLIHANSDGPSIKGQDTINNSTLQITGGTNNPNGLSGKTITQSDSIVTVPVYDPATMAGPGNGDLVKVVGYLQMFIQYANHQGNDDQIQAVVLNVSSCGKAGGTCAAGGSGGSGGSLTGGGSGFYPVRLIHP